MQAAFVAGSVSQAPGRRQGLVPIASMPKAYAAARVAGCSCVALLWVPRQRTPCRRLPDLRRALTLAVPAKHLAGATLAACRGAPAGADPPEPIGPCASARNALRPHATALVASGPAEVLRRCPADSLQVLRADRHQGKLRRPRDSREAAKPRLRIIYLFCIEQRLL